MRDEDYFPKNESGKFRLYVYGGQGSGPITDDNLLFDTLKNALIHVYENADMWALQLPDSKMYKFTKFDDSMMLSPFIDYTSTKALYHGVFVTQIKKEHDEKVLKVKTGELEIPENGPETETESFSNFKESLKELLDAYRRKEDIDSEIESLDMDLQGSIQDMTEEEQEQARTLLEDAGLASDDYL